MGLWEQMQERGQDPLNPQQFTAKLSKTTAPTIFYEPRCANCVLLENEISELRIRVAALTEQLTNQLTTANSVNTPANKKDRKAYMREYMKKKRAATSAGEPEK